eukprot:6189661-Pleurochrysis_carterae.AAC.5
MLVVTPHLPPRSRLGQTYSCVGLFGVSWHKQLLRWHCRRHQHANAASCVPNFDAESASFTIVQTPKSSHKA